MADEKDVEQANGGAPAMDIPDLKKKEKERKKAGAAWGSAKPVGSPFGGATGGVGAGARAAAGAASSAAGTAASVGSPAAFSGISSWLARVLSTVMGKMIVGLGALLLVGGAGLAGLAMLRGGGGEGSIIPSLGGLSSSLQIDRGGSDRTSITGKGDIRFDPVAKAKAVKTEEAKIEEQTAGAPADTLEHGTINDAQGGVAGKDKLAHNLSGAKLTSSLGGGFGSKNIFGGAGSANAPKFNGGLAKANLNIPKGSNGKLGKMKSNRQSRASRLNANKARTQRAFGQLKVARGLSTAGAGAATADGASSNAADAFDQRATNGGTLNAAGADAFDGTPTNPGGGGAPDVTSVPDVATPDGVLGDPTMDQNFMNVEKLAAAAGQMKMMGMMLMALGAVLMAIGASLMTPPTTAIGVALMAIGAVLIGIGMMLMQMAAQMAAMAKQLGSAYADQYGTGTYQREAVNDCTDQALANGGTGCNRPAHQPPPTTVQQDVEAERSTPVTMEGNGGPVR